MYHHRRSRAPRQARACPDRLLLTDRDTLASLGMSCCTDSSHEKRAQYRIGQSPKGAGAFVGLLAAAGLPLLPAAVIEFEGC